MTLSRKQLVAGGSLLGVFLLASGTLVTTKLTGPEQPREKRLRVEAKRVVNGHYVKLDDEDKLVYAGIRAPYENEPYYEEARQRNVELVVGKDLRLRFDQDLVRDKKDRLFAYAFVDGLFINQTLVREGLAYVRLRPETQRFAEPLLAAQADARRAKRGLWSLELPSDEASYPADPKYAEFHRPSCEVVPGINPEHRIDLKSKDEAFRRGFAPCNKCLP